MPVTTIEWTRGPNGEKGFTFNPWVGCTKVSPACDNCYAEGWAKRAGKPQLWSGERRRTTPENWRQPLKWNRAAERAGTRLRVFCASLADVFDNQVPVAWRVDLLDVIRQTTHLDWLLLTKRPSIISRLLHAALQEAHRQGRDALADWIDAWLWGEAPSNVWLGTTAENQPEANRRIPKLLEVQAVVHFVSIEPLIEAVDLTRIVLGESDAEFYGNPEIKRAVFTMDALRGARSISRPGLDWVIVGGESGGKARPMHPAWARSIRDACAAAGVAYFHKQNGEWAPGEIAGPNARAIDAATWFDGRWLLDRVGPAREDDHVDDEPDVFRVGKARAGRLLDGREHNEMPRVGGDDGGRAPCPAGVRIPPDEGSHDQPGSQPAEGCAAPHSAEGGE